MNEDQSKYIASIFLIIFVGWIIYSFGANSRQEEIDDLKSQASDYKYALSEANSNIEDAKESTWQTYDDMGYALDGLSTVSEP